MKTILSPPGSGKTEFVKLWHCSIPLIDTETNTRLTKLYDAYLRQFGPRWWEIPSIGQAKDKLVHVIAADEGASAETIFVTPEFEYAKMAESAVLVLIPFDQHTLFMSKRLNEHRQSVDPTHPVYLGSNLRRLREVYYNFALRESLQVVTDFVGAYWMLRNSSAAAETIN
jgi:hypothetical protein